jgi:hypothetical protein
MQVYEYIGIFHMKSISKDEYWKLIQSSYEDEDELSYADDYDNGWIPATYFAKQRMEQSKQAIINSTVIDVLKYRKEQLKDTIYKYMNLKVGEFLIHIRSYNGKPTDKQAEPLTLDIVVMQEKTKTPSGSPCKMSYKMDFFQDNRFTGRPWLAHFTSAGYATHIPVETVIDIVKWMQSIYRLSAFL